MQTENSLVEILQPTAPAPVGFSEWLEVGRGLYEQRKALEWECADWLSEGHVRFPEQMALVWPMLATDPIEQKQLTRSAKIAASIPVAQRCTALTFAHHMHVADLPVQERLQLLGRAQSENLSARAMRILALEVKGKMGMNNGAMAGEDLEYYELMAIVHKWNCAQPDTRTSFLQNILEAVSAPDENKKELKKWIEQTDELLEVIEFGIIEA